MTQLQQQGLDTIFDERKVAERMEMGQVAGEVGFKLAGDLSGHMRDRALSELAAAEAAGDQAAIEAAQNKVLAWSEGGLGKTGLHGVTGAAMAALGGGNALQGMTGAVANQLASNAIQSHLLGLGYIPGTPEYDSLLQLGSLAVGAVTGGGSGAASALSATQNNYLNHAERMEYLEAALACAQAGDSCGRAAELEVLSESRNDALRNACADRSSSACQGALQNAIAAADDHKVNQGEYLLWMASNGSALLSAGRDAKNDTLIRNVITQTTTTDLIWKIDCARAGSDCSTSGSAQLLLQGDPASAARHEAMRAALQGAGQIGGIGGRAVDTVTGLYELLREASPVTQLGRAWAAVEYVNAHGLAAYLEMEEAKSKAVWSGMWGSAKDYMGDIGSAIRNNALGGPQWDVYDVYMQGNTEGKVGFDVLGLFVGGTEINAFAKAASAERKIAAAFAKAQDEAVESARIANNFYRDGSPVAFPQEIRTSSGIVIKANPDKTTTILGTYVHDTNSIINGQLSLPRSTIYDGSARPGSFNLLNTPDELYKMLGPDLFWERVNAPFIDAAIARGDDIVLATRPEPRALNRDRPDGTSERSGFGREYDYLVQKGY